jgi:signal recognition particle subunit SRP72
MASSTPDLATLLRQTNLDSDADILKATNVALKKSKSDELAQRTKVIALLKLDRYTDAVKAFEDGGNELKDLAPVEYAYALWKTGDLEKAKTVVEKHGTGNRGLEHVAAQTVSRSSHHHQSLTLNPVLSVRKLPRSDKHI